MNLCGQQRSKCEVTLLGNDCIHYSVFKTERVAKELDTKYICKRHKAAKLFGENDHGFLILLIQNQSSEKIFENLLQIN